MLKAKKKIAVIICAAIVAGQLSAGLVQPLLGISNTAYAAETKVTKKAKNVIFLIPDGMSVESVTLARLYYDLKKDGIGGNDQLTMDSILTGLVKTYWQDGPITDSAPGGTAYSTGFKTEDKHIGVLSNKDGNIPKATLIEAARQAGKATGLIATSEVTHATPADFSAHAASRSQYNSIMKQMVYGNYDLVLGGGDRIFSSEAKSDNGKTQYRKDEIDLREVLKSMGYTYLTTRDELNSSKATKMWGLFAPQAFAADIDREKVAPTEPTLEEMTNKALEILSKDKDGFFLMVEGSQIDWAGHANDPSKIASEIVAYDKAVKAALDFAKKDGNTVVISASDHSTGGGTLGMVNLGKDIGKDYASVTFEDTIMKLTKAKASTGLISEQLKGKDVDAIKLSVKENFGFENLTEAEIKTIQEGNLTSIVNKRVGIAWSSDNHTAGDVGLYCYSPAGVEKLSGLVDNTEVAKYLERVTGLSLAAATSQLFQKASVGFEKLGGEISIDASDIDNPVIIVTKGSNTLKLYGFTDQGEFNGTKVKFDGIIVPITKDGKNYEVKDVYVPQDVLTKFHAYTIAGKVVEIKKAEVKITESKTSSLKTGIVNASALNVRASASSKGEKIGVLKNGAPVTIVGESGGWYKINYGASNGYVYKTYVTIK